MASWHPSQSGHSPASTFSTLILLSLPRLQGTWVKSPSLSQVRGTYRDSVTRSFSACLGCACLWLKQSAFVSQDRALHWVPGKKQGGNEVWQSNVVPVLKLPGIQAELIIQHLYNEFAFSSVEQLRRPPGSVPYCVPLSFMPGTQHCPTAALRTTRPTQERKNWELHTPGHRCGTIVRKHTHTRFITCYQRPTYSIFFPSCGVRNLAINKM